MPTSPTFPLSIVSAASAVAITATLLGAAYLWHSRRESARQPNGTRNANDRGETCGLPAELLSPPLGACDVRDGLAGAIGETPLIYLRSLSELTGCVVLGKAEFLNPGGSSKDRVARAIVKEAEDRGALGEGGTIFEGTAGSTGISLALMARSASNRHRYGCCITMPDDMSNEKAALLGTFGAEVRRVKSMAIVNKSHYVREAERAAKADPSGKGYFADQFENLANFRAHYFTTGQEIWRQTGGAVDAFVMAAGTGGTLSGVAVALREKSRGRTRAYLIDPPGSSYFFAVTTGVCYTPQQAEQRIRRNRYDTMMEGIGLDRLTRNFAAGLDAGAIDGAFRGTDLEAVRMARFLLHNEGLFLGSSSAMNCVGVVKAARGMAKEWKAEGKSKRPVIVTTLCDSGQRGISKLYSDDYLAKAGLLPWEDEASRSIVLNSVDFVS